MFSFFRRAGAQILRVLRALTAPASAAGEVQVYALDSAGVTELFARTTAGITQLTGVPTEVELDFGSTPVDSMIFEIADPRVTVTSKITIVQSGATPTGRTAGESELDPIAASARASGAGTFTVYCASLMGRVVGKYKFNYQIGT